MRQGEKNSELEVYNSALKWMFGVCDHEIRDLMNGGKMVVFKPNKDEMTRRLANENGSLRSKHKGEVRVMEKSMFELVNVANSTLIESLSNLVRSQLGSSKFIDGTVFVGPFGSSLKVMSPSSDFDFFVGVNGKNGLASETSWLFSVVHDCVVAPLQNTGGFKRACYEMRQKIFGEHASDWRGDDNVMEFALRQSSFLGQINGVSIDHEATVSMIKLC